MGYQKSNVRNWGKINYIGNIWAGLDPTLCLFNADPIFKLFYEPLENEGKIREKFCSCNLYIVTI